MTIGRTSRAQRARRALLLGSVAAVCMPRLAQAAALPLATDLPRHLAQALSSGQPLVVMVSLHGCPFCKLARESYLLPMLREQALPVVQTDMRSAQNLRDFAGIETTHDAQIRAWRVRMAPTVLFFGRAGNEVAPRLVGAGMPDFYGAYLEERLATARKALS